MLSKLKVVGVIKSIKSHHCDDGVNGLSSVQAKNTLFIDRNNEA